MPKIDVKRQIYLPQEHSFFLFGPRQSGKTTLLKKFVENKQHLYYDLLDNDDYSRLARDSKILENDIEANPDITHVVIDEVQLLPQLLNSVHRIIESNREIFFALTGSSARKLKRGNANLLAGRAWHYKLHPLTHIELDKHFNLNQALMSGSLPPVYFTEKLDDRRKTLKSYVEVYLNEEIKAESLVRNLNSFSHFLELAADSNGEIVNFSELSREINVSSTTIKDYFQILEDTLVAFMLMPYASKTRKQLVKHPRFYFCDLGLVRAILKKPLEIETKTKEYGDAFEHFIISEFIRLNDYYETDLSFSFFRTKAGAEVDLIIKTPRGKIYAIEIKSSLQPNKAKLQGLKSFLAIDENAIPLCVCLTNKKSLIKLANIEVLVYPWQDIFKEIFQKDILKN